MNALAVLDRTLADTADRESWLPIPRYEGQYEASATGAIRSVGRLITRSDGVAIRTQSRVLRPGMGTNGYLIVSLYGNGRSTKRTEQVHVLIAEAFHGPRPKGLDVMHRDANRLNNAWTNLRYGSRSENIQQVVAEGHHGQKSKTRCPRQHLLQMPNLVRSLFESTGYRECLACKRARHVRSVDAGVRFEDRADIHYASIMGRAA